MNALTLNGTMNKILNMSFVVAMTLVTSPAMSQTQDTTENAPALPCTEDAYRHFDFWLGEWDVTGAGAQQATARSKISSKHGGCVVLEEYAVNSGAYTGMSINFYDSVRKVWHQSWMANNGVPVYLEGSLNDAGAMVLSDEGLEISKLSGTINRVTWTASDDGSVRQFWETSSDGGKSWAVVFDGRYAK